MIPPSARTLALIATLALSVIPVAAAPLPPRLAQVLHSQGIPTSAISLVIRDARSGEPLLELNPRQPRSPASTLKVLTTLAALEQLGPSYHWTTRAWTTAPVVDGRLMGDLVIQGGGDPYLSAERWWRFAQALRNTGLKRIDGNVVLDRTLYTGQVADPDEFDAMGYRSYNVLPDALLVNLQTVEFHVVAQGSRARVIVDPEPANLRLDDRVQVFEGACPRVPRPLQFTPFGDDAAHLAVDGQVSAQCPGAARRVIMHAPDFAFGTFVTFWRELGGEVSGGLRLEPRPASARLLIEYESLSLAEIVRLINKHSSNVMARMLVLTLASERYGAPATVVNGERALSDWLADKGLHFPELVIDNGSGLSRVSRISADSLARVLGVAVHSPYWPEFAASLPLGGQDGTLKHRYADLATDARIRMKTGHLDQVGAIAGIVTTRAGRPLSVVVLINHPGAQRGGGDAVIDTIVRWALDR